MYKTITKFLFFIFFLSVLNLNAQEKMNVVMIVLDDLNDFVSVLGGHPQAKTPNMDRLASQGVLFTNAHSNVAVCSPSRASFMRGILPTTSGVYAFNNPNNNEILKNSKTLPTYARENGYKAYTTGKIFHHNLRKLWDEVGVPHSQGPLAYNGKKTVVHPDTPGDFSKLGALDGTFLSLKHIPKVPASNNTPGFDGWWNPKEKKPFRYVNDDDRDLLVDEKSVLWLQKKMKTLEIEDDPFLIAFGIMNPHTPLTVPQKYYDMYPLDSLKMPYLKVNDKDDCKLILDESDVPRGLAAYRMLKDAYGSSKVGIKTYVQAYLACITFADEIVGDVLDTIDNSKFNDNTIVVLFSDHGYHMGEKDFLFKYSLWEESTRVPLMIRDPRYPKSAGQKVNHPVSLVDIFPTITDLCGMKGDTKKNEQGASVDGHSLKPFLENPATENWDGPNVAISIRSSWKSKKIAEQHLAARSKDYRYIHYSHGGEELYNHANDPHEWNNLAENPEYKAKKEQLKQQLFDMLPKQSTTKSKEQSAEEWKTSYFKTNPDADANKDGKLTWAEYHSHKKEADKLKLSDQEKKNNEWKDNYFKKNPEADTNNDGELTWQEYNAHRKK